MLTSDSSTLMPPPRHPRDRSIMVRVLKKADWFHSDGFGLEIARRSPQEPFGVHSHEFAEIVVITGGSGLHVTGTESWVLSAGDVFVIGGSQPHDYQGLNELCLINILFDPSQLDLPALDVASLPGHHALFGMERGWRKREHFGSRLRLSARDLAHLEGLIDHLDDELQRRDPGFRFLATALFMQIVGFLSRCYSHSNRSDTDAVLRIAETIAYLEHNYRDNHSLDELAERAHMSRRTFIRAFEAATGSSPIAYVIQLRINRAAELLRRHDDMGITEVAFEAGFHDSNYFTRQFRQIIGIPPSRYRAQHGSLAGGHGHPARRGLDTSARP